MKPLYLFSLFLLITSSGFSQNIIVSKKRPPKIDISGYQKIAIGDIVGATGAKTTRSMDLSDALTSQLFNNSDGHEVIDRNALEQVLASQKNITVINEATVSALSKKMNSALMIVARIQNEKVYAVQKTRQGGSCATLYWDELTGDMTAQVKIIDIKTGRMLFTNAVVQPINVKTVEDCDSRKADPEPFLKETTVKLADQIVRLIVPWDEKIDLPFIKPLSLFKSPFKKLPIVIQNFQAGNNAAAFEILKEYLDNTSFKPDVHQMAAYNYGVGLFIENKYPEALEYFKMAKDLNTNFAADMIAKTQTEQNFELQMAKKPKPPVVKP